MKYLFDRLSEPGTMRSLIWVLLATAGLDRDDTWVTNAALVASVVLGAISAAMPEQKP